MGFLRLCPLLGCLSGLGIQLLRFVKTPAGPLDIENDGMMHHPFDEGGGDHRVTEIISEFPEINVRCQEGGPFAVAAVNDLKEQGCLLGILLLQAVKSDFIDQEEIRSREFPESSPEGIVCPTGQQGCQHVGGGRVTAAILPGAAEKQQSLRQVTFSRTRVSCNDQPLLSGDEVELGQFHDLGLVYASLKIKVEIGQQFPVGNPRLPYPTLNPAIDDHLGLNGQKPLQDLTGREVFLDRLGQLPIQDLRNGPEFQGFQMGSDSGQSFGLRFHGYPPFGRTDRHRRSVVSG